MARNWGFVHLADCVIENIKVNYYIGNLNR